MVVVRRSSKLFYFFLLFQICDEFYRQGDYERQLQLRVTPMFDRYANSVANIQTSKNILYL